MNELAFTGLGLPTSGVVPMAAPVGRDNTPKQPRHTDENVYNGTTGKWSRRPRVNNDNVAHGGGWWNTVGDTGILNAGLVGYVLSMCIEDLGVPAAPEKKGIGAPSVVKGKGK